MPAALMYNLGSTRYNWFYKTTPQKNLDGRSIYWPRGRSERIPENPQTGLAEIVKKNFETNPEIDVPSFSKVEIKISTRPVHRCRNCFFLGFGAGVPL